MVFIYITFITCISSSISTRFAFKEIMDEIVRFLREKGDFLSASEIKRIMNITSKPDYTPFEGNTIIIFKNEVDVTDKNINSIKKKGKTLLQNMVNNGYFTYGDLHFSSK